MDGPLYLDHNATTPVDPRVIAAAEPYLREAFGNASSIDHQHGHIAASAVERAREQVAVAIGARPAEIVFTSGCTEANNLAIFGAARALGEKRHIVTSAIEHPAVLEPLRALEAEGWRVTYLPVDSQGRVSADAVQRALEPDTGLVSIMGANNEVGTLQPIGEIGGLCAARDILFHSDLAQVAASGGIDVERDNLHLASLSGHKVYGPKGVGALYVRSRRPRVRLRPLVFGGGQERGLRPGTLNTPGIVGLGAALSIAASEGAAETEKLRDLGLAFRSRIEAVLDDVLWNGAEARIASNLSLTIPGVDPFALMRRLGDRISFSAASACATGKVETSHVLVAMFGDTPRARGAFRIAPGRFTTLKEMERAADWIAAEASRLRAGAFSADAAAS
ncbi:cysteine desulfurase family protein [Brevundimonas goettingensis]|uniref:Cysteine desulfurase n=1 Tax=Brevundimonas goettingensis TaxID=2774190 RepID=A0A975C2V9_9CAUL|nr:cysteine desulfurase family protein [Brevundimonas goettingensis]QTC90321.1 cysteine desulfurase [Brevundimonas goettingensis]